MDWSDYRTLLHGILENLFEEGIFLKKKLNFGILENLFEDSILKIEIFGFSKIYLKMIFKKNIWILDINWKWYLKKLNWNFWNLGNFGKLFENSIWEKWNFKELFEK